MELTGTYSIPLLLMEQFALLNGLSIYLGHKKINNYQYIVFCEWLVIAYIQGVSGFHLTG